MSLYLFLASDKPLKSVKNTKVQAFSINEAIKLGIITDTAVFDNSKTDWDVDKAILYSESEEDFREVEIFEDDPDRYAAPYTKKKYVSEIRWYFSERRARQLMDYVCEHLSEAGDIELWNTWMDDIGEPEIKNITMEELTTEHIRDVFGNGYHGQPFCLKIGHVDNILPMKDHYEAFYSRAEKNEIFAQYCKDVFGIDFSQDGFSDIDQIHDLIRLADIKPGYKVLDIGCGNGKMAEYIADKTGAMVYGFDYSKHAIKYAESRTKHRADLHFDEGAIGVIEYPSNMFDVIISVDTMYFAPNLCGFVGQIHEWLKSSGIFITYFGEGPVEKISVDADSTELALALKSNSFRYKVMDYTKEHYELMKRKHKVALSMKEQFMNSDQEFFYTNIMNQSITMDMDYQEFLKVFNRNLYIAQKSYD